MTENVWDYPRPPRVDPSTEHVVVTHGGIVVADTTASLRVLETSHPPTYYLPVDAFAPGVLRPGQGASWCEWKGQAAYLDLVVGDDVLPAVAWTYPTPSKAFAALVDHVALYPGRVDRCTVDDEVVQPQPGNFYGGWITSRPAIGSIGRAIDIGVRRMGGRWSPLLVGAPRLQRYQLFGHLFAAVGGVGHRLDRHPTMSRHPVTPMAEADLTRHLAAQTARRIGLVDMPTLKAGRGAQRVSELAGDDVPVLALDVLDDETLRAAGRLVWEERGAGLFSAASSGLQDALAAHWRACGWLPAQPSLPVGQPVAQIAAVSGSCSPVTAAQIQWARANGFAVDRLALAPLFGGRADAEIERAVAAARAALQAGRSPLVFSAEGPDDPAVTGFDALAAQAGVARDEAARRVGEALAEVMRRLLQRVPLQRVVVAGGDSSGEVAQRLGIDALTVAAGLAPGAPLCQGWRGAEPALELVLKGGQMGTASFFGSVRAGRLQA